jgi:hypothetical protein
MLLMIYILNIWLKPYQNDFIYQIGDSMYNGSWVEKFIRNLKKSDGTKNNFCQPDPIWTRPTQLCDGSSIGYDFF